MLQLTERYWAGKPRLLRLLDDLKASSQYQRTVYLTPASLASRPVQPPILPLPSWEGAVDGVLREAGDSETGLVMFLGDEQVVAAAPPFPVEEDTVAEGAHISPLVELLTRDRLIGVVLLRLGRYAVGVLQGQHLVASKTGSRYVKSRHRAGGSSQRRFERSRERLVRELFDKTCEVARDVYTPYEASIDHVIMGGERHTLLGFAQRCRYLKTLEPKTLKRVLQVERPGQKALAKIAFEVWKSRVLVFARTEAA